MSKIITRSNWGEYDQLDGIDLQAGEVLIVEWPSGTISEETVRIKETSQRVSEQGGFTDITTRRAYIEFDHHGCNARVYLRGVEATRSRPPKFSVGTVIQLTVDGRRLDFRIDERLFKDGWRYHLTQQPFKTSKPSIMGLENPIRVWRTEDSLS